MSHLLKFCYLFLAFSALACQPKDKSQEEDTSKGLGTEKTAETATEQGTKIKTIVFFGNSLTAGYGLDPREAFPALIQKKLDSLGLKYNVINAGLSGETTSGGDGRVDWVLNQKPDVFVLELGANDGLRGIPLGETRSNLQSIIKKVQKKNPEVEIILAGMQIPPNMGPEYTAEFRTIFPDLAESNNIALIPFLLDGVAGNPELNQRDGIHPTAEGQLIVASNVWSVLEPLLE